MFYENCLCLLQAILIIFTVSASASEIEKDHAVEVKSMNCVEGEVVENDCNECMCSKNNTFICTSVKCERPTREMDSDETKTFYPDCTPNTLYSNGNVSCLCNERGAWPFIYCEETFLSLSPNKTDEGNLYLQAQRTIDFNLLPKQIKTVCEPNTYVKVDCNICRCNAQGYLDEDRCTQHSCGKSRRVDPGSKSCEPKNWYSLAPCQFCYCVRENKLVCNSNSDDPRFMLAGDHNLAKCGFGLLKQVLQLVPNGNAILNAPQSDNDPQVHHNKTQITVSRVQSLPPPPSLKKPSQPSLKKPLLAVVPMPSSLESQSEATSAADSKSEEIDPNKNIERANDRDSDISQDYSENDDDDNDSKVYGITAVPFSVEGNDETVNIKKPDKQVPDAYEDTPEPKAPKSQLIPKVLSSLFGIGYRKSRTLDPQGREIPKGLKGIIVQKLNEKPRFPVKSKKAKRSSSENLSSILAELLAIENGVSVKSKPVLRVGDIIPQKPVDIVIQIAQDKSDPLRGGFGKIEKEKNILKDLSQLFNINNQVSFFEAENLDSGYTIVPPVAKDVYQDPNEEDNDALEAASDLLSQLIGTYRKAEVTLESGGKCVPGTTTTEKCNSCFCMKNGKLLCTNKVCD